MRSFFRGLACFTIGFLFAFPVSAQQLPAKTKLPGVRSDQFVDTKGEPVNAHGMGILLHNGTYYMYGEIKKGKTWLVPGQNWEDYRVPAGGVSCYSSTDLLNWKFLGVALSSLKGNPAHDLDTGRVIERPKVVYNRKTKKFVMWMHIDANDYQYAQAGCAISDQPQGPFTYLGSVRPNGQMARDLTLYKDEDERAYLVYASENNNTMQVCLLSDNYQKPTTTYTRITSARQREAPAIFKFQGKYYLVTSDCTGWSPNRASYATADSLLGEWTQKGDPSTGKGAETTFQSQSTFILPVDPKEGKFIFMADRWNKSNLPHSSYLWLPFQMKDSILSIRSPYPSLGFSSPKSTRIEAGSTYTYKISTVDSSNVPVTINVKSLPSWLKYNSVDQTISGKTKTVGQFPIHIVATTSQDEVHYDYMLTVYDAQTVNILALGNSITNGTNRFNSYRRILWQLLHQGGYNFDFVGSWDLHEMGRPVPNPDFDMDHEGHSGWKASDVLQQPQWDSIRGNIHSWIQSYNPDIVLLELGTNEVFQCITPEDASNNLSRIIDILRGKNPKVKILLAQIPPLGKTWSAQKLCGNDKTYAKALIEMNLAIQKLAASKNSADSKITLVDQYHGMNTDKDMYDDIHPNPDRRTQNGFEMESRSSSLFKKDRTITVKDYGAINIY